MRNELTPKDRQILDRYITVSTRDVDDKGHVTHEGAWLNNNAINTDRAELGRISGRLTEIDTEVAAKLDSLTAKGDARTIGARLAEISEKIANVKTTDDAAVRKLAGELFTLTRDMTSTGYLQVSVEYKNYASLKNTEAWQKHNEIAASYGGVLSSAGAALGNFFFKVGADEDESWGLGGANAAHERRMNKAIAAATDPLYEKAAASMSLAKSYEEMTGRVDQMKLSDSMTNEQLVQGAEILGRATNFLDSVANFRFKAAESNINGQGAKWVDSKFDLSKPNEAFNIGMRMSDNTKEALNNIITAWSEGKDKQTIGLALEKVDLMSKALTGVAHIITFATAQAKMQYEWNKSMGTRMEDMNSGWASIGVTPSAHKGWAMMANIGSYNEVSDALSKGFADVTLAMSQLESGDLTNFTSFVERNNWSNLGRVSERMGDHMFYTELLSQIGSAVTLQVGLSFVATGINLANTVFTAQKIGNTLSAVAKFAQLNKLATFTRLDTLANAVGRGASAFGAYVSGSWVGRAYTAIQNGLGAAGRWIATRPNFIGDWIGTSYKKVSDFVTYLRTGKTSAQLAGVSVEVTHTASQVFASTMMSLTKAGIGFAGFTLVEDIAARAWNTLTGTGERKFDQNWTFRNTVLSMISGYNQGLWMGPMFQTFGRTAATGIGGEFAKKGILPTLLEKGAGGLQRTWITGGRVALEAAWKEAGFMAKVLHFANPIGWAARVINIATRAEAGAIGKLTGVFGNKEFVAQTLHAFAPVAQTMAAVNLTIYFKVIDVFMNGIHNWTATTIVDAEGRKHTSSWIKTAEGDPTKLGTFLHTVSMLVLMVQVNQAQTLRSLGLDVFASRAQVAKALVNASKTSMQNALKNLSKDATPEQRQAEIMSSLQGVNETAQELGMSLASAAQVVRQENLASQATKAGAVAEATVPGAAKAMTSNDLAQAILGGEVVGRDAKTGELLFRADTKLSADQQQ